MKSEAPDPIKQLENTINWHMKKIGLIEKAIIVLKENSEEQEKQYESKQKLSKQKSSKQESSKIQIQWSKEIDSIFEKHNNLTVDKVIEKLIENGINETIALKSRNIVYCTIMRKCKEGKGNKLNKNKNGVYSRIIKTISTPISKPDKEEEGEVTN